MSTKISALPPSAGLVLTDIFAVVDDPGGVPVTQKATLAQLETLFSSSFAPSGSGVTSFNTRTGAVTLLLADVSAVADARYVLKAGDTMTGALVHPVGTAALPSITFTGDLNTGIYRSAADTVGISAGGTVRLQVASALITSSVDLQVDTGNISSGNFVFQSSAAFALFTDAELFIRDNNIGVTVAHFASNSGTGPFGIQFFDPTNTVLASQQSAPTDSLSEVITALRAYGLLAPP